MNLKNYGDFYMVTPEDEKTQTVKLEEEVAALQTRIKNTEYDLKHMFRGNQIVEQKLHNTKQLLEEKQNSLAKLTNTQVKEVKKIESILEDSNITPISKDQKAFIDEEIEHEFL